MLTLTKKKIKRAGGLRRVKQLCTALEDLSMFSNETFDVVLCLGAPLRHLLNAEQREKDTTELTHVAKKDTPIFVSVISRIGLLKSILVEFPH